MFLLLCFLGVGQRGWGVADLRLGSLEDGIAMMFPHHNQKSNGGPMGGEAWCEWGGGDMAPRPARSYATASV